MTTSTFVTSNRGVAGSGSDASPDRRPGVPMENEPPRPVGAAHWQEPERQPDPGNILKRKGLEELTPVFGTAIPPRGLSGVMRRFAYGFPEHSNVHWLVLLLADRIDAIRPHDLECYPVNFGAGLGAGFGFFAAAAATVTVRVTVALLPPSSTIVIVIL